MVYLLKSLFYLLIKASLKLKNNFYPKCGSNPITNNGIIYNNKAKPDCKSCPKGYTFAYEYQFIISNTKKTFPG